jgi:3-oxoacyl-[acyl-carrier-protein] synthase II
MGAATWEHLMTWSVTGTGLVSSLGTNVESAFAAYGRGESGRHPLRGFAHSQYRVRHAYEIADRLSGVDEPGRATRWLLAAVAQAIDSAGLTEAARCGDGLRMPVIVGTGLAELRSLELWRTNGTALDPDDLHFGGAITREFGPRTTVTLVNACAAGLFALAVGTDLLDLDEADAVVVAATDSITESMFGLLDRVNGQPPSEVRPFDAGRRGVLLGEGAAAVVIEPVARARSRAVRSLAVIRGIGITCDAHHVTAPLREGIVGAFRDAHHRAGLDPGQIDLVMTHGTGTVLNDRTEALALVDVFGGTRERPVMTALKSLIGHTSGASGLMSLVTAIGVLGTGRVPPTLNHTDPIAELGGLRLATRPVRADVRTAQVNAFGFGGVNAVAVIERAADNDPADNHPAGRTPAGDRLPVEVSVTGVGMEIPGSAPGEGPLELFDAWASRIGTISPPDFTPQATLGQRGLRYKDRATQLALCAAAHALADAGLDPKDTATMAPAAFGVIVSSTFAIADTVCRVVETIHAGGVAATSPMDLPNASANVAASSIAIWFGLTALNLNVSSGATSGVDAIHLAATAIRAGRAQRMLVVGVEPADEVVAQLMAGAGSVSPNLFDGACAVVLEAEPVATARGARTLAVVERYGQHAQLDSAVDAAQRHAIRLDDASAAASMWFTPCSLHASEPAPPAGNGATIDVSSALGEASSALGVLQCAGAAQWLADRPNRRALISSGGCWGGRYACLTLRGVG